MMSNNDVNRVVVLMQKNGRRIAVRPDEIAAIYEEIENRDAVILFKSGSSIHTTLIVADICRKLFGLAGEELYD